MLRVLARCFGMCRRPEAPRERATVAPGSLGGHAIEPVSPAPARQPPMHTLAAIRDFLGRRVCVVPAPFRRLKDNFVAWELEREIARISTSGSSVIALQIWEDFTSRIARVGIGEQKKANLLSKVHPGAYGFVQNGQYENFARFVNALAPCGLSDETMIGLIGREFNVHDIEDIIPADDLCDQSSWYEIMRDNLSRPETSERHRVRLAEYLNTVARLNVSDTVRNRLFTMVTTQTANHRWLRLSNIPDVPRWIDTVLRSELTAAQKVTVLDQRKPRDDAPGTTSLYSRTFGTWGIRTIPLAFAKEFFRKIANSDLPLERKVQLLTPRLSESCELISIPLREHVPQRVVDRSRWLDLCYNTENNADTPLGWVHDLADGHGDLKRELTVAMCDELAQYTDHELLPVLRPLLNQLGDFAGNPRLQPFIARLTGIVLSSGCANDTPAPFDRLEAAALAGLGQAFLASFNAGDQGPKFATRNNQAIYSWLRAVRETKDDTLGQLGEQVQNEYGKCIPASLMKILGERRHQDAEEYFALISADGKSSVLMHDDFFRNRVLGIEPRAGDSQYQWSHLYSFTCEAPGGDFSFRPVTGQTFSAFPVLRDAYASGFVLERHSALIDVLGLAGYAAPFRAALGSSTSRFKLVSPNPDENFRIQLDLANHFRSVLEAQGDNERRDAFRLTPAHVARIRDIYCNEGDSQERLAQQLYLLGALFAKYSSSSIFGVESDSPQAVRDYAVALLNTAGSLAPGLVPQQIVQDWRNRLAGIGDAFTCTSVVYNSMTQWINERREDGGWRAMREAMIPQMWR